MGCSGSCHGLSMYAASAPWVQISQVLRSPTSIASRSAWSSKYAGSISGCHDGSAERSRRCPRLATETRVGAAVTIALVGSCRPLS